VQNSAESKDSRSARIVALQGRRGIDTAVAPMIPVPDESPVRGRRSLAARCVAERPDQGARGPSRPPLPPRVHARARARTPGDRRRRGSTPDICSHSADQTNLCSGSRATACKTLGWMKLLHAHDQILWSVMVARAWPRCRLPFASVWPAPSTRPPWAPSPPSRRASRGSSGRERPRARTRRPPPARRE
jgi:hypothetical protein